MSAARSGRSATSSRRPGCRPSSGPTRRLLDDSRRLARERRLAAHGGVHRARARAARPGPARAGSARRCSSAASTQLAARYEAHAADDWHWFEDALTYDNARLPHALIVGGAALGREDADRDRPGRRCGWLGRRVAGSPTDIAAPDRAPRPATDGARSRRGRRAAARRLRASSRPSWPRSPSPAIPSTARAQRRVRLVPRPQPARPAALRLRDRRLQRRARRARRSTTTRAPSRRSPSTAPQLAARRGGIAAPSSPRLDPRAEPRRDDRRELFRRHPAKSDPDGGRLAVSGQRGLQPRPPRVVDGETVLLARVEDADGHLAPLRRPLGQRGRRLDDRSGAAARAAGRRRERAVGLRGPARRLGRRARSLGDHVHRVRPGRARRSISRRPRTSDRSSGTGSSCIPRTRTRHSCRSGSTASGCSSTGRRRGFGASRGEILLSRSADLISWSAPEQVLQPRDGAWWDSLRIGIGPPPLRTEHGWLLIYHGVKETVAGGIYRVGLALLDLEEPTRVLHRLPTGCSGRSRPTSAGRRAERRLPVRARPRRRDRTRSGSTTAPPTPRSASRRHGSRICSRPCWPRRARPPS